MDILTRTTMLIGHNAMQQLSNSTVAIYGLGGVGGYAVEALARAGIGHLVIVDNDTVDITNINRQILALSSTVGQYKTAVAEARIRDINPNIQVTALPIFVDSSNIDTLPTNVDYVIDAIDTVTSKLLLIQSCHNNNIPIISCMGTGNKMDATQLTVTDIYSTHTCPLARVMRRELQSRNIPRLKVVFSPEQPATPLFQPNNSTKRVTPSSISTVPAVGGMLLASTVINDLIQ